MPHTYQCCQQHKRFSRGRLACVDKAGVLVYLKIEEASRKQVSARKISLLSWMVKSFARKSLLVARRSDACIQGVYNLQKDGEFLIKPEVQTIWGCTFVQHGQVGQDLKIRDQQAISCKL